MRPPLWDLHLLAEQMALEGLSTERSEAVELEMKRALWPDVGWTSRYGSF
jgi:hypothetical protein